MRRLLISLGVAAMLSSCAAHRIRIESDPAGAAVDLRGKDRGATPVEVTTFWFPMSWWFYDYSTVSVEAPGFRDGKVRVGRKAGRQIMWDYLLILFPDEFNGVAPWKWRWGHFTRVIGVDVRHTHQVQLVRHHGRAGTWEPEDAERAR